MIIRLLGLAGLIAMVSGCNNPVAKQAQSNVQLIGATTEFTGSPISKVTISGNATNTGTGLAHNVIIYGYIGNKRSNPIPTSPPDIAPGEIAHWSLSMTGSTRPRLEVYWN